MNKIYLLLKLPPPVHGSTLMNQLINSSELIKKTFETTVLGASVSTDTSDIGKWSIRKITTIFKNYKTLYDSLKYNKPELFYFALSPVSFAFLKDFISIAIIKSFNIPIVYHYHGKGISTYSKKWLYRTLYKSAFDQQFAIVLADELRSDIAQYKFQSVYTIPNGIKTFVQKNPVTNENTKSKDFTLLYLSNFVRSKGLMEFLNACKILKQEEVGFKFIIIGKPIDVTAKEVNDFISENNLFENVSFIGSAYDEEKFKLMLSSDLLIFPTYYANECFPLVLLEAMQCGLPIITSREGGIPSLIKDKKNGILVNPRSPEEIASAIKILYANEELRMSMRLQARGDFEKFYTVEAFETKLVSVLNQILKELHETNS